MISKKCLFCEKLFLNQADYWCNHRDSENSLIDINYFFSQYAGKIKYMHVYHKGYRLDFFNYVNEFRLIQEGSILLNLSYLPPIENHIDSINKILSQLLKLKVFI